jgi:CBS domain-containing protein
METSTSGVPAAATPMDRRDQAAGRRGKQWAHASVTDAMSRPVLTIESGESLWDAWLLLSVSGLRHLVVVEDGQCRGVLSDRMILTDLPVSEERFRARTVGALVASTTLRSVRDIARLVDVARTMANHSTEAVVVLDGLGRPVGIVTGSDLVRWWADDGTG